MLACICDFIGEIFFLFKMQRVIKEKMIFAEKNIEKYNIAHQLSQLLKGVRSAERSLGWLGNEGLGLVLLGHAF